MVYSIVINQILNFKQKEMGVCCYNPGHIMKKETLKKHEEICKFTSRGVPKAEALVRNITVFLVVLCNMSWSKCNFFFVNNNENIFKISGWVKKNITVFLWQCQQCLQCSHWSVFCVYIWIEITLIDFIESFSQYSQIWPTLNKASLGKVDSSLFFLQGKNSEIR